MGCTEKRQICNSNNALCTNWTGLLPLTEQFETLAFTNAQMVTAQRFSYMLVISTVYFSVFGVGPDALRMYSLVYGQISPHVPEDQWRREVNGWAETTLAKWQALAIVFAHSTADLGLHGHLAFPNSSGELDA